MEKGKLKSVCLGLVVGVVFIMTVFIILTTTLASRRTTEAQRYDLNCVTTYNKEPLKECKEK